MTIQQLYRDAVKALAEAGVPEAEADARLLLAKALGMPRERLIVVFPDECPSATAAAFQALVARRRLREPVQHLLKSWAFLDLELEVSPAALIPRHDTEDWIEHLAQILRAHLAGLGTVHGAYSPAPPASSFAAGAFVEPSVKTAAHDVSSAISDASPRFRFADIGTGTGAIGLWLACHFPRSNGILVDISSDALKLARRNLARFPALMPRVALLQASLASSFQPGSLDLVVSNPPYIEQRKIANLMPEVSAFEPRLALDGGPDGLDLIRILIGQAARVLKPGGLLAFEHGHGQREAISRLPLSGLSILEAGNDATGRERYFIAAKT